MPVAESRFAAAALRPTKQEAALRPIKQEAASTTARPSRRWCLLEAPKTGRPAGHLYWEVPRLPSRLVDIPPSMPLLWLRVAVLLYAIAALAVLPAALYNRPRWRYLAMPAALGGVFFHFVALVETLAAAHHALPVDTHESLSLLGLLLAGAFLGLAIRYKTVAFGIFLLPDRMVNHAYPKA